MARKRKKDTKANNAVLPVMRPDTAGIDIGATEIFVAVPADRAAENVRSFPTFTQDLYASPDWLRQCELKTVAMESTGVRGSGDPAAYSSGILPFVCCAVQPLIAERACSAPARKSSEVSGAW